MHTLGINAAFHDSAACLVKDGIVAAAAEEERFTGVKHAKRPVPFSAYELPFHAIDYCLREAGIGLRDVQNVAYSFDPDLLPGDRGNDASITLPLEPSGRPQVPGGASPWDPLFRSYIVNAPRQLAGGAPHHLRERFAGVRHDGPFRWSFVAHHLAHAASAFFASPFADAAVLVLDGRGERATTSYYRGSGAGLMRIGEVDMPHSLGLLYEATTEHLGFLRSSDEYKVMALASYGRPVYRERLRQMITLHGGQYEIRPFEPAELFGPARARGSAVEQRHCDVARSLQDVLEETVLDIARWLKAASGADTLCIAGGVGLNCVLNARLRDRGPFANVWVQPAAGDAGTALGAALLVDNRARGGNSRPYVMEHVYLGPSYDDARIEEALTRAKCAFRRLDDVAGRTAELLAQDRIVGWFQGRMEFGPRALGARSILASPLHADMQRKLNEIKDREDFRPVAPVVLEEEAGDWFAGAGRSPFMLFVCDVLRCKAPSIPAVVHTDGTARVQTVRREQNPRYYDLIAAFRRLTGVPVLVNTSFNTRGRPIVRSPQDALECFWTSPLDALVMGSFLVEKH